MKKVLNKWQIIYMVDPDLYAYRLDPFTRKRRFGVIKITSFPDEGIRISKHHYKGFLVSWWYWLPIKFGDKL